MEENYIIEHTDMLIEQIADHRDPFLRGLLMALAHRQRLIRREKSRERRQSLRMEMVLLLDRCSNALTYARKDIHELRMFLFCHLKPASLDSVRKILGCQGEKMEEKYELMVL